MQFKTIFASLIAAAALAHAQYLNSDQTECVDALEVFRDTGRTSNVLIDGSTGEVTRCFGCYLGNMGSCSNTELEFKDCVDPYFWTCIENQE